MRQLDVQWEDDIAVLNLIITAPEGLITRSELASLNKALRQSLRPYGVRGLRSTIRIIPVELWSFDELSP